MKKAIAILLSIMLIMAVIIPAAAVSSKEATRGTQTSPTQPLLYGA